MIFTYAEFKKFIDHCKSIEKIIPVGEWDGSKAIILRHDVDFNIESAYRLALIEAECEIRSTFFFLTTCDTYNLFSAPNRMKLREMANLGFELGLHFDPTIYGNLSVDQFKVHVDQEAEMLSQVSGLPVRSISLHNPSSHRQYPMFEGYINAYDKNIFSDESYLSDSQMDFRGKNPYTFAERAREHAVQILLHPLHYSETGLTYPDIVYEHIKSCTDAIDNSFRGVNSKFESQILTTDLFSYIVKKGRE